MTSETFQISASAISDLATRRHCSVLEAAFYLNQRQHQQGIELALETFLPDDFRDVPDFGVGDIRAVRLDDRIDPDEFFRPRLFRHLDRFDFSSGYRCRLLGKLFRCE